MKTVLKLASSIGLVLSVVPAFFVLSGSITWDTHATLMAIGALVWFATAPLWMAEGDASETTPGG